VELARLGEKPVADLAKSLGISESCLRNWMRQAQVEAGQKQGVSSAEREELRALRRQVRVLEMEKEILKKPRPSSPWTTSSHPDDLSVH